MSDLSYNLLILCKCGWCKSSTARPLNVGSLSLGLSDPFLGTIDRKVKCETCSTIMAECPGHFGHLELAKPMYHIGFMKTVLSILCCVCFNCSCILTNELESALRASETAQSALCKDRENTRAAIYIDEEFISLQCQVTKTNLLRESNAQLRDENKRNFEEFQELRDRLQNVQLEIEQLCKSVREKDIELDVAQKELEMQKMETRRWENKVSKLLEKHKPIDVEHYEHIKVELQLLQGA